MRRLLIPFAALALIAPSLAHAGKFEPVEALEEEDGAGYNAGYEVDFRNLTGEGTTKGVSLTIELWTPWADIENPEETDVTVELGKAKARAFTEQVTINYDGTWELRPVAKGKKKKKSDEEAEEPAALATGQVNIDGTTISLVIPWENLPYDTVWLKVKADHTVEPPEAEEAEEGEEGEEGEEAEAVETVEETHPASRDQVPNGAQVLVVSKP
jgi:hypothetical protein